ncbi:MAG: phage tail-type lysozyme domain-containing protein [Nocardiopsaceae bacterium]|nr:phage tail-type lysozyme domain-containing protein [Nocardiopsaceae bacterium]
MSSPATHARKWKIRRNGRHKAPSPAGKVAKTAGKAAPAVAVLGALATASPVHNLWSGADPSAGRRVPPAAHLASQAASTLTTSARLARTGLDQPRHAQPAVADRPARDKQDSQQSRPARHRSQPGRSGQPAGGGTPHCSGSGAGGPLPANYATIVSFLMAHGYTGNAAAGIAGNIYQESMGNPESVGSGGGGLIGWTPLPGGLVTGNEAADLQAQLKAILDFNQQWSQYLPALNGAGSPAAAADIYVTDFERAGIPATSNREAAASAVAAACGL